MIPTYDEIEEIKQSPCDGCKGLHTIHETGCYMWCEDFQIELFDKRHWEAFQEALKEMRGGENE
jgi:hypothetical protein